jgi:hypothetical protein
MHACLYIYMYRIQWKYIILFVYIHLKYLYMGHDVLAYVNVRDVVYHMYSSIIVCIGICASIYIRVFILRVSVK